MRKKFEAGINREYNFIVTIIFNFFKNKLIEVLKF